jgi:rhodanese-related sulfurtransferase
MMEETADFILLDVRTDSEYREAHIPGSRLIPDYEISARAASELPDKNAVILVYCRSGHRSAGAARNLAKMGYTKIYDLGGIMNWPYETVSGGGK